MTDAAPTAVQAALLLAHLAASCGMTGFIWTMQVLHYPLFDLVGSIEFLAYEAAHNRRFLLVAGPLTLVVLLSTVGLALSRPSQVPLAALIAWAVLLLAILVSTAAFQAPAHARLQQGFDAGVLQRLLGGNWIRVAAWTLLAAIDLALISAALR